MSKHGVSRRYFAEADVKDFKSGALKIATNITRKVYCDGKMQSTFALS